MDTSRKEFRYNWIKSLLLSSRFLFSSFLSSLPSSRTPSTSTLTHSWVSRNGYSAHRELLGNRHTAVLRFECWNDEAECSQDAAGYVSCLSDSCAVWANHRAELLCLQVRLWNHSFLTDNDWSITSGLLPWEWGLQQNLPHCVRRWLQSCL